MIRNGDYIEMKKELNKVKDSYFNFEFMAKYIEEKIS